MKKSIIIIVLVFAILKTHAQNYQISFTGSGQSTTVASVQAINLTQSDTLTLNGYDTLYLVFSVGIHSINVRKDELLIYPNPMSGDCKIKFYNPKSGAVSIKIFDVTGKIIVQSNEQLQQGTQTVTVAGLKTGVYSIKVNTPRYNYTNRIISVSKSKGVVVLKHENSDENKMHQGYLKGTKNIVQMQYNEGEILLLKGISWNYTTVLTIVPTQSQTVDFEFVACTDADFNHYAVVTIGSQTWMVENLKTTKYNDGSSIPLVTDPVEWSNLLTPGYCWYNNDEATYKNTYGALYNWYAVNSGNLCPTGWHVPFDHWSGSQEWTALVECLGGPYIAGGKLKETGIAHWNTPNGDATNEKGFAALPGGDRDSYGSFLSVGEYGSWWSASTTSNVGWFRRMNYINGIIGYGNYNMKGGFSIRCLKNQGVQ